MVGDAVVIAWIKKVSKASRSEVRGALTYNNHQDLAASGGNEHPTVRQLFIMGGNTEVLNAPGAISCIENLRG